VRFSTQHTEDGILLGSDGEFPNPQFPSKLEVARSLLPFAGWAGRQASSGGLALKKRGDSRSILPVFSSKVPKTYCSAEARSCQSSTGGYEDQYQDPTS
jgi:hypothetical protein